MFDLLNRIAIRFVEKVNYVSPGEVSLTGQVVVVTGASRGIGKAICDLLLEQGARVVAISRDIDNLKRSLGGQKYLNSKILLIKCDITSEGQVTSAFATILKKFQKIDVLINNAAVNSHKAISETTLQEFNQLMDTNIKGIFLTCRAAIPVMKEKKDGLIINIGSKISHNTNVGPNKVLYATSKYAVEGFTYALRSELSSFGIRVTCLMPGTVNTFISRRVRQFLSPFDVANLVLMILKFKEINFESILFKSKRQEI